MVTAGVQDRWTGFGAAAATEALKLRRGIVTRFGSVLLVAVVPLFGVGAVALARAPQLPGAAAVKFAPYATGDLAATHLLVVGQLLSVTVLLAGGFAYAWSYGREFSEATVGAMAGLAVGRGTIALAKGVVLTCWLAGCVVGALLVTLGVSVLVGGGLYPATWSNAGLALAAGLLGVSLVVPFGWVASLLRSQLGTVGVLIGLVVVTQLVVVLGAGAWFPYAVPSLLTGMAGAEVTTHIGVGSVLLTASLAPIGLALVAWRWRTLDDT